MAERGIRLFYALAGGFVLVIVLGFIGSAAGLDTSSSSPLWELHVFTLISLWIPQLVVSGAWAGSGWQQKLGLRFEYQDISLGIPIGIAAQLLLPILYLPFLPLLDSGDVSEAAEDIFNRANGVGGVYVLIIFVVLLGPLVEEIFFRGFLQSAIFQLLENKSWAKGGTIFLSALIFAGAHFLLVPLLGLFALGLLLGYVRHRTDRIGMAVGIHIGFNFASVILLLVL